MAECQYYCMQNSMLKHGILTSSGVVKRKYKRKAACSALPPMPIQYSGTAWQGVCYVLIGSLKVRMALTDIEGPVGFAADAKRAAGRFGRVCFHATAALTRTAAA
jgi:hypothetical protein